MNTPTYYDSSTVPPPDRSECFARPAGDDLIADFFAPEASHHNGAAVLLIHGGGWKGGTREAFRWHAHRLALHGYLACTIDYRLAPAHRFPAALDDCRASLDWLIKRATDFQIDPKRIGVIGSSAGGHLAACLGVANPTRQPPEPPVTACVVDIHGLHDLPAMIEHKNAEMCEIFIGGSLEAKRSLWELASPARHVDSRAAPMLITHDPNDPTVPYDQSVTLVDRLCRAACPVQFIPTPDSGHGFFYNPTNPWVAKLWPVVVTWLDRYLLDPSPQGDPRPELAPDRGARIRGQSQA